MDFIEQAQLYFRGEKLTGITVAIIAVGLLATAAVLWWVQKEGFARGLASVLLVMGIAGVAGGSFLAIKTGHQVNDLTKQYQDNGAGLVAMEGERMEKVVRNFAYYRLVFYAAVLAALGLLVFLNTPFAIGIAVGLLLFAAAGISIDTYTEHRAKVYLEAIQAAF
jgi:hypothetical protein